MRKGKTDRRTKKEDISDINSHKMREERKRGHDERTDGWMDVVTENGEVKEGG